MTQRNDVMDAYVREVMRRLPASRRDDIGMELRELLHDTLAERVATAGREADDAMVLDVLAAFGTPTEVAARYQPPGWVIIPATQTRSFAVLALAGVAVQWALSVPAVIRGEVPVAAWWFSGGLGALWWPGFLTVIALVAMPWRHRAVTAQAPSARALDPERVHRGAVGFGLVWMVIGVGTMVALPWLVPHLPGVLPQVLAFDATFLHTRAPVALLLWAADITVLLYVWRRGRRSPWARRFEVIGTVAWMAVLSWWMAAGRMFEAPATDAGARGALALLLVVLAITLLYTLYRQRIQIRMPLAR